MYTHTSNSNKIKISEKIKIIYVLTEYLLVLSTRMVSHLIFEVVYFVISNCQRLVC